MTFTVLLDFQVKDGADDVEAIVREVLAQTAAFAGNEGLEVLVDDEDPNKLLVVEKWESVEARNAYIAWRATPEGASRLGTLAAAAPTFRTFEKVIPLS
jgi:quinol monooxygenase YgiN